MLNFLKRRLNKKSFYGLPLSASILAISYILLLFTGVVEGIVNSDFIVATDTQIANFLASSRDSTLTQIFLWITLLGRFEVTIAVLIISAIILWQIKKIQYILPFLVSALGGMAFTFLGKLFFQRERPSVAVYPEQFFSFPSWHATIAISLYGFLAYVFIRNIKLHRNKILVLVATVFLIILIGFSRLYLGVHYLSDVWGGYLAGALWLIIGITLYEALTSES